MVVDPLTSALTEVEVFRMLDRLRLRTQLEPETLATVHANAHDILARLRVVALAPAILAGATQPFPTPLGTRDAMHLATLLVWREQRGGEPVVATHDRELALAARAAGFEVVGA